MCVAWRSDEICWKFSELINKITSMVICSRTVGMYPNKMVYQVLDLKLIERAFYRRAMGFFSRVLQTSGMACILVGMGFLSNSCFAVVTETKSGAEDDRQKYPGGMDEEDLTVQSSVLEPPVKMNVKTIFLQLQKATPNESETKNN